jgi:hypothetical protein
MAGQNLQNGDGRLKRWQGESEPPLVSRGALPASAPRFPGGNRVGGILDLQELTGLFLEANPSPNLPGKTWFDICDLFV